jgi:hypothetical protein
VDQQTRLLAACMDPAAAITGVDLFLTNDPRMHSLSIPGIGFIAPLDRALL